MDNKSQTCFLNVCKKPNVIWMKTTENDISPDNVKLRMAKSTCDLCSVRVLFCCSALALCVLFIVFVIVVLCCLCCVLFFVLVVVCLLLRLLRVTIVVLNVYYVF